MDSRHRVETNVMFSLLYSRSSKVMIHIVVIFILRVQMFFLESLFPLVLPLSCASRHTVLRQRVTQKYPTRGKVL